VLFYPAAANAIGYCGKGPRIDCIVDGDTLWLNGEKIRLAGIDAPEPHGRCVAESRISARASARLKQLVEAGGWTIERTGRDRFGRTLARFRTAQGTFGEVLVREGLAKVWHGHKARWCDY
jgi:endonuclease YncB( thermonuclease family)